MEKSSYINYGITILISVVSILITQFVSDYSKAKDNSSTELKKEVKELNARLDKLEKNFVYVIGRYTDAPLTMDAPPKMPKYE